MEKSVTVSYKPLNMLFTGFQNFSIWFFEVFDKKETHLQGGWNRTVEWTKNQLIIVISQSWSPNWIRNSLSWLVEKWNKRGMWTKTFSFLKPLSLLSLSSLSIMMEGCPQSSCRSPFHSFHECTIWLYALVILLFWQFKWMKRAVQKWYDQLCGRARRLAAVINIVFRFIGALENQIFSILTSFASILTSK